MANLESFEEREHRGFQKSKESSDTDNVEVLAAKIIS